MNTDRYTSTYCSDIPKYTVDTEGNRVFVSNSSCPIKPLMMHFDTSTVKKQVSNNMRISQRLRNNIQYR